ncbi:diacylglycerol/lipid kinase family protein [Sorlinia euscelidii]|uniref:diacylglycerol/lipid kinase family protein n=1 Tax=Sorlinia euscelidii TaxID=3081148 RepID=UPI00374E01C7
MPLALINNPRSRKNRRCLDRFTKRARHCLADRFFEPRTQAELRSVIEKLHRQSIRTIAISGGDGTISDVMTALYHVYGEDDLPELAIFPSGNSNLIARDVGFKSRGRKAFERLLHDPQSLTKEKRGTLRIKWTDQGAQLRIGMFHGTTGFTRAIDIAHSPHLLRFAPHNLAVAATLIATLWKLLHRKYRNMWLDGDRLRLECNGVVRSDGPSFLFISTALDRLTMGMWPFWDDDQRRNPTGLRFLNVSGHPQHLWRAVRFLVRGRSPKWLRQHPSYHSDRADSLTMTCASDFILDGEKFSAGPSRQVTLSNGPQFQFLHD